MKIDENSTIKELTNGEYSSLSFDSAKMDNYSGPLVSEVIKLIDRAGGDVTNTRIETVGSAFRNVILAYQKKFKLPQTGVLTDDLLHDIYLRANQNANNEINNNNSDDTSLIETDNMYDAHYDPFFLNNSEKVYRKNHKDIIIAFGDQTNYKIIKDVFMRSVSVQVDTSGNPISETYTFIARDIKETDAPEDIAKYIGEENVLSSSSDIKYNYEELFKDK